MPRAFLPVTAISAALFACMIPMQANAHPERFQEMFSRTDANGDGVLDREEASALPRIARSFDAIDADGSGTVIPEEVRAYMQGQAQARSERARARFDAADVDGDGVLDRDEAKALPRIARSFDAIDVDGSGTVSQEELAEFHKGRRHARNR